MVDNANLAPPICQADSANAHKKGCLMRQQRNLWELQHTTICKVMGMALDLEDLKRFSANSDCAFRIPMWTKSFRFTQSWCACVAPRARSPGTFRK